VSDKISPQMLLLMLIKIALLCNLGDWCLWSPDSNFYLEKMVSSSAFLLSLDHMVKFQLDSFENPWFLIPILQVSKLLSREVKVTYLVNGEARTS